MKMKRALIAVLAILAPAVPAAANAGERPLATRTAERPLARVDGEPITGDDLERAFKGQHGGHLAFLAGEAEVREALANQIDRVLLLHEAERLELGDRPEVRRAVDALVGRLALEHLLDVEISQPAQPTEAEIRAAYDAYTDSLLRVRQIVVADRAAADAAAARLAAGEPFEALARELSQAASRRSGGALPPIRWGTMGAEWDDAVFALAPGGTTAPFWNGNAWEIVQLVERLPVARPAYEKASSLIQGALLRRKLAARQRDLSTRLFAAYGATIRLQPCDPATYAAAAAADPATVVASWQGGELSIADLQATVDLGTLSAEAPERAAREIEGQVRVAVNERLAQLEAAARDYRRLPDIQAEARRLRADLMEATLYREFVTREVHADDADVRAWYEAHPEALARPERRRVSQIVVAGEAEALAARERLGAGTPFAELAKELSSDRQSAAHGGDLGWITARETPPGFESVFAVGQGEVTPPIRSSLGWHLIEVGAIEPARTPAFDEVADEAREHLLAERQRKARERWLVQLRAAAEVEIDDRAVKAFASRPAPAPPQPPPPGPPVSSTSSASSPPGSA